eukprot:TRINITY_DN19137_c0_g1_i1.p1 TRINITY_DN19137_c0_g1~~TRINITY_DN19137_c0_g1_i1.p1  ORF type:complete len:722 (+),score=94.28 TRINITY_DN19137_c0_g1_i1:91-2166(+)
MDSKGMRKTCKRPCSSRSASQFQEPVIHHVYQGQSIQQKIDCMNSGDVCIVHQGTYRDPIKITTRNITIKAAEFPRGGGVETIKLSIPADAKAQAAVLFSLCQYSLIQGITIQNDGGFGIVISKCSPEVTDCTITGSSGGVKISKNNEYSQLYPIISNCTLHHCQRGPGVHLQDAKAIIENNEIHHNNDAGIAYSGLSNPWISNNTLHSGNGAGIAIQNTATGVIRDNTIYNNDCAGIMVENGSHPIIWKNTLRKGKAEGIRADSGSKGVFDSNILSDHASCEVMLSSGCTSMLTNNSFRDCSDSAVIIDKSSPYISKNSFYNINASCITITGNGTPSITSNTFSISSQPAITVGEHCNGSIENNTFVVYPSPVSSPAICKKRGTFVKVHDNVVKHAENGDSPFDVSLQLPECVEDDTESDGDDANELAAEFPPTARRHSAFAERISAMSNKRNSTKSTSPADPPLQRSPHPDSDHNDIAAGSGGAAVIMRKHFEFPPSGDDSPTAISDIHLSTIDTPSLPVTPVHDDDHSQHSDKRVSIVEDDPPIAVNGKNRPLEKLPSKVKAKSVAKVVKKSNSATSTPSSDPKVPPKKKRESATVAGSYSWVDKTALKVLRSGSTGKVARRRSTSRENVARPFNSKPASERSVADLSEVELKAELEAVRKLLTVEEQRQELQLLRNWLGSSRIKYRR